MNFTHRLGLKLGIEDPEQWLDDCPDRVFQNWYSAYRCQPFGGETELLTRIVSLLYVIAGKDAEMEKVFKASDAMMKILMPNDWVGNMPDTPAIPKNIDAAETLQQLQAMESVIASAFSGQE